MICIASKFPTTDVPAGWNAAYAPVCSDRGYGSV